jgi:hypothetical protein
MRQRRERIKQQEMEMQEINESGGGRPLFEKKENKESKTAKKQNKNNTPNKQTPSHSNKGTIILFMDSST